VKRTVSLVIALILAAGAVVTLAAPAQAANVFVTQLNRTIESTNKSTSQKWHMQIWQDDPQPYPSPCYLFGRSLMDTKSGPLNPWDHLDTVKITDVTTGNSSTQAYSDSGAPPIDLMTRGVVAVRANTTHFIRVEGTAHVDWSASDHGPEGYHRVEANVHCYPVSGFSTVSVS